jgi:hypothetical protein
MLLSHEHLNLAVLRQNPIPIVVIEDYDGLN